MEFAAIQSQRRLQGVLQKKREEARRRKEAAEKKSRAEAEAKAEADRLEAAVKKKRQVESMLVMIEQGIRTFGYVEGVTTTQIRSFFAATYVGMKINDELFRAALQKGVHDRRLRHGTRRGKLDVNSYLLFEEVRYYFGYCEGQQARRQAVNASQPATHARTHALNYSLTHSRVLACLTIPRRDVVVHFVACGVVCGRSGVVCVAQRKQGSGGGGGQRRCQ